MRKKHFKLGMVILFGLAGYFLILSAVLVASAGIFNGGGFGDSAGKKPHVRKDIPRNQTASLWPDGKSAGRKSGVHAADAGTDKTNPCLTSACGGSVFEQNADGSSAWTGDGLGGSAFANSQGGAFGGRDILNPASYGFGFSGAGSAFASSGGAGQNGGTTANPAGLGDPAGGTSTGFTDPNPGADLPAVTPSIPTLPPISPFLPGDPPGSADPGLSTSSPSSDPAPQSDPAGTTTVPEPPTYWLFLASLIAVAATLRPTQRARPAPAAPDYVSHPRRTGTDGSL